MYYIKYNLLLDPKYSINDIADIVGVKPAVIHSINVGNSYHDEKIDYPIRDIHWINKKIFDLLKTHKCTLEEINAMVYPDMIHIKNINKGKIYHQPDCLYPIVKYKDINPLKVNMKKEGIYRLTKEPGLLDLLIYSLENEYENSIRKISEIYGLTIQVINEVNKGILFFNPTISYPIRNFDSRYKHLEKEEIKDIIKMLKNPDFEKKDIKSKYAIDGNILSKIDMGEDMYRIEGVDYPIRGFRKKTIRLKGDK